VIRITLPIPGFVSVVGFAVGRLTGDGIQLAPGLPLGQVRLSLFLLGKLFVGNKCFHHRNLLAVVAISISQPEKNS
jgi:hypothetical protein